MIKKIFSCLLVFCMCMTIIPNLLFANATISQKKIGVLRFKNDTNLNHFGQTAADYLTADLVKLKSCSVIERSQLDRVIAERNLNVQGFFDPETVSDIGGILGLDYLLMGTVSGGISTEAGHSEYNKRKKQKVWVGVSSRNT